MVSHVRPGTMTRTIDSANAAPKPHVTVPRMIPPHPPLQSGGWYHGQTVEAPGPGRPPVHPQVEKSAALAMALTALFGPLGLFYLSTNGGIAATVVTVTVLGFAGMGFWPLLLLWPLSVAVAAWLTNG
jgi:hypothetical protein